MGHGIDPGRERRSDPVSAAAVSGRRAGLMLALSVLLLGVNWPVMKLGLEHVPPVWMVSLRFLLSAPVIAAMIALSRRRAPVLVRADLPVILGVAVLQLGLMMGLVTLALSHLPAGTASILIYTTPIWLVLLDASLGAGSGSGAVDKRRIATALMSGGGCALIVGSAGAPGLWGPMLLILLASGLWAITMRLVRRHRWQGGVRDALFWQMLIAGGGMAPLAYGLEGALPRTALTPVAVLLMLVIGPVASGGGFGLLIAAGRQLPAAQVALVSTATPLIGFVSAALLLGETAAPVTLLGGGVMLAALVWGALPRG